MLKKTVSVLPVSECPQGQLPGPGIFEEHCAQREAGKEVGQESPRAGIAGLGGSSWNRGTLPSSVS